MAWKPLIAAAFLCNIAFGNVCLLEVARAMSPQAERDPLLMSRIDAADCPLLRQMNDTSQNQRRGCADGHCLVTPLIDTTSMPQLEPLPLSSPPCLPTSSFSFSHPLLPPLGPSRPLTHSPPPLYTLHTVVLHR